MRKFLLPLLVCIPVVGIVAIDRGSTFAQDKKEAKKKDPMEGKKGTIIGILTAKEPNFIEVKSPGEEKARKFVPEWKGGAPAQGGGLDKEILKKFAALKIGSRVEVEWVFHERLRALDVKVLEEAKKD
jgi:hypothetical protein